MRAGSKAMLASIDVNSVGHSWLSFFQGAAKALIFPVVQQFTEAFVQALQMPDGPTSDSGLKMEVLKVRESCVSSELGPSLSIMIASIICNAVE